MTISFNSLKVFIWPPYGWRIHWGLSSYSNIPDGTYIVIERAAGPEGPWTNIGQTDKNTISWEDPGMPFRSFFDKLWYRLSIYNESDELINQSTPTTNSDKANLEDQEIIRQHNIVLYGVNGNPGFGSNLFACYKRTIKGEKCNFCTDHITSEIIIPRCHVCHGTRYIEGYANPIIFAATILDGETRQTLVETTGESESMQRAFFTSSYPELEPGDIIAQKGTGERFRVDRIDVSKPNNTVVSQRFYASKLYAEDIAAELGYPNDRISPT